MRAIAHCAEPVKRRNSAGSGEVAVRSTADGAFIDGQVHLRAERFRASEKGGAHFALEGSAVEAAMNLETRAGERRAQRVQAALKTVHVGNAQGAEIENHAGALWDHVGARAALDEPSVDGDAATQVVPFLNARDLPREF